MIIRELCGCSLITKGLDSIVKYGDHCSKHSPNNKNELIIEFTPPLKTAGLLFQSVAPVETMESEDGNLWYCQQIEKFINGKNMG